MIYVSLASKSDWAFSKYKIEITHNAIKIVDRNLK